MFSKFSEGYPNLLRKVAIFQSKNPVLTVLLILALTLVFLGGHTKVETIASLESMMPSDIEEVRAFNDLRDNAMGKDVVGVVLYLNPEKGSPETLGVDIRDRRYVEYSEEVRKALERNDDILQVYSLDQVILSVGQIYGLEHESVKEFSDAEFSQVINSDFVHSQLPGFVDESSTKMILISTSDVGAYDKRMKALAERIKYDIEALGKPPVIDIYYTGTPMIQQKLGQLIAIDRTNTQNISTLLVFLITALLFFSFSSALVPIIVVSVSVAWLYGLMGYLGLPISTLAGGVAAMVIGIGIDYSIHLMNKFKNERAKGNDIESSLVKALTETGVALSGAAFATILAFLAFLFGQMPEMNRFGLLMALGVGSAFIISIFGLPSLLILEERVYDFVSRKFKFGIDGEFKLRRSKK